MLWKEFKDREGESFFVNFLPGLRTHVVKFEYKWEKEDKFFGNAIDVLDLYNKLIKK